MKAFKAFIKSFDEPQANQLAGFYIRATLEFNGLKVKSPWTFYFNPLNAIVAPNTALNPPDTKPIPQTNPPERICPGDGVSVRGVKCGVKKQPRIKD